MDTAEQPRFSKRKRIIATLICFSFLLAVILTSLFITLHADHDCSGEDCVICVWIQHCEDVLHLPGTAPDTQPPAPMAVIPVLLPVLLTGTIPVAAATLVSHKIRIDI